MSKQEVGKDNHFCKQFEAQQLKAGNFPMENVDK